MRCQYLDDGKHFFTFSRGQACRSGFFSGGGEAGGSVKRIFLSTNNMGAIFATLLLMYTQAIGGCKVVTVSLGYINYITLHAVTE